MSWWSRGLPVVSCWSAGGVLVPWWSWSSWYCSFTVCGILEASLPSAGDVPAAQRTKLCERDAPAASAAGLEVLLGSLC